MTIFFSESRLQYNRKGKNIDLTREDPNKLLPALFTFMDKGNSKGKTKGKGHPRAGHVDPEGSRGIALLFL